MSDALMRVDDVSMLFARPTSATRRAFERIGAIEERRALHALDHASLELQRGEVLGLVGESGCGKSTLGRVMTGILAPSKGSVSLEGQPIMGGPGGTRKLTPRLQMIFQNPFSSLNPRIQIGRAIAEGPVAHGLVSRRDSEAYACDWLSRVGLDASYAKRYPHQFSGGQRQRIAIARALAMQPDVVVCDEPVASLDVSIQAQIINLFLKLKDDLGLTLLFISHDLGVVKHLCDRVAVMYLGKIVELASTAQLYDTPLHPYTSALLESVPALRLEAGVVEFRPIKGELPSPLNPPSGCAFRTRCPLSDEICRTVAPPLRKLGTGRMAACHFAGDAEPSFSDGATAHSEIR